MYLFRPGRGGGCGGCVSGGGGLFSFRLVSVSSLAVFLRRQLNIVIVSTRTYQVAFLCFLPPNNAQLKSRSLTCYQTGRQYCSRLFLEL